MPEATFTFPADMKWGVSTSSHQVEGGNTNNDWWQWEEQGRIVEGQRSGKACDWWRHAEADFDRAAELGCNALRLSVEWSRIEPQPGEFDDGALSRYWEMLAELRSRGIEPMVTLHHFTNPLWLAERGAWESRETVPLFARYVREVVEALGNQCDLWCTINEPTIVALLGYIAGTFPPGRSDFRTAMAVVRNMLYGHAAAYRAIHEAQSAARVGLAHTVIPMDPANPRSRLDRWAAHVADSMMNEGVVRALARGRWVLPLGVGIAWRLRNTLDWIGLNYYTRKMVRFDRRQPRALFTSQGQAEGAELLDGGLGEFYPKGIFRSIRRLQPLGVPIYITEHGTPDEDDDQRPRHLLAHLHQTWHAIQLCCPVMGYYHWTLVDNFEWARGWAVRFGLFSLNPETQKRTPRNSARLYSDIVRERAITPQMIDQYAPELRPELLPGGAGSGGPLGPEAR
jgi:beta-glucosidase